jgi:hypothetical protein
MSPTGLATEIFLLPVKGLDNPMADLDAYALLTAVPLGFP